MANEIIVKTRDEFKEAINSDEEKIIVVGSLEKKVNKLEKFYKLSPKKRKALLMSLTGLGPTAIAALVGEIALAPVTGGLSAGAAALTGGVTMAIITAQTGVSLTIVAGVVVVVALVGTDVFIKLSNMYNVESHTGTIKIGDVEYSSSTIFYKKENTNKVDNEDNKVTINQ